MTDPTPAELWTMWRNASRDAWIDREIVSLYADVDQAIRDAPDDGPHGPPTCVASGRCCKFDTYGHRLYVTGLEIAWFMRRVPGLGSGVSADTSNSSGDTSRLALPLIASQHGNPTSADQTQDPETESRDALPDACRYQVDGLCSTHTIRPLGCRVYFCTPGTEGWQHTVYERFLSRLQQLHNDHALPYRYMEWRSGLIEADRWLGSH